MAELKVYLPDDLDTRFRKAAMSLFGYGRGSLSKAAVEALDIWCSQRESKAKPSETSVSTSIPNSALKDAGEVNGQGPAKDKPLSANGVRY